MEGDVLTAKNVDEEGLDSHSKKLEDSTDLETARGTPDSAAMELQFREGSVQGDFKLSVFWLSEFIFWQALSRKDLDEKKIKFDDLLTEGNPQGEGRSKERGRGGATRDD